MCKEPRVFLPKRSLEKEFDRLDGLTFYSKEICEEYLQDFYESFFQGYMSAEEFMEKINKEYNIHTGRANGSGVIFIDKKIKPEQ